MYRLKIDDDCKKIFSKLSVKNPRRMQMVRDKISRILDNPEHFKPLSGKMKGLRRVHIDNHFVLIYEVVDDMVIISDFDHHDHIYR
jgi:YafQ family addiction module toxin component